MVKDKKVDVIARDYTINLHKALHGMYAAPKRNSSSLGLGCAAPCAGGAVGLGARGNSGRAAAASAQPAAAPLGPRRGCRGGAAG